MSRHPRGGVLRLFGLRTAATAAAFVMMVAVTASSCGGDEGPAQPVAAPDLVWRSLGAAREASNNAGLGIDADDVREDRAVVSDGNWIVVEQDPRPGTMTTRRMSVGVVKDSDIQTASEDLGGFGGDGMRFKVDATLRLPYAVQVDRQQLQAYAVAESPKSDLSQQATRCARRLFDAYDERLLETFGEVYCYIFRTPAAFQAAEIGYAGESPKRLCWSGVASIAQAGEPSPPEPTYLANDPALMANEGCP